MSAEIIPFVPRDYDPRRYPAREHNEAILERLRGVIANWPAADNLVITGGPVDSAPSEMNPQESG